MQQTGTGNYGDSTSSVRYTFSRTTHVVHTCFPSIAALKLL